MSLTNLRKTFQAIAMLTPAISLLIIIFKNDNLVLSITLIGLAMFGMGFVCAGDSVVNFGFIDLLIIIIYLI